MPRGQPENHRYIPHLGYEMIPDVGNQDSTCVLIGCLLCQSRILHTPVFIGSLNKVMLSRWQACPHWGTAFSSIYVNKIVNAPSFFFCVCMSHKPFNL